METIQYALKQTLGIKFGTFTIENFFTAVITFVVCFIELCWLYSLFEKRISENVFQARITTVEYEGSNNQWEGK